MKRLLAIVMSMVFVLAAEVSCFNPNKETEAEYKARIKKELDAIPVEATGYKLVDPTKNNVVYPEGEEPQRGGTFKIDNHIYRFVYGGGYEISYHLDEKDQFGIQFSENEFFSKYREQFTAFYYDKKFFIVRYRIWSSMYAVYYYGFLPPILFYCNIEDNTAKYVGYLDEWFEYQLDAIWWENLVDKIFTIVEN